ncbi:hypothetical protein [Sulfitobacter sp. JB4-11]|uniref:hypothetical protein n=1 Tax=Sulfitobacter rhodophyticola TaxID=3238304 RepID=UPI003511F499
MEPDLALVLGLVIAAFSVPSILSALADSRAPRASAITILIGGGLVLYALQQTPNGYALQDIPDVFVRVVARYMP